MIVILHEISHISNINKFYTISCFPRRRSISWLQMAKNVFMKSFYLFYKVNWFFGHWTKLFTAKDMDTQETNYNYFKKIFFTSSTNLALFTFLFFFLSFFFKENQNNMLVQKFQVTSINSNITTFDEIISAFISSYIIRTEVDYEDSLIESLSNHSSRKHEPA